MKKNVSVLCVSVVRLIVVTRSSGPPVSQFGSEWDTRYVWGVFQVQGKRYKYIYIHVYVYRVFCGKT